MKTQYFNDKLIKLTNFNTFLQILYLKKKPAVIGVLNATSILAKLKHKTDTQSNIKDNKISLFVNILENRLLKNFKNSKRFEKFFVFDENNNLIWKVKEKIFKKCKQLKS